VFTNLSRVGTRDVILDAAAGLMRSRGLAATTTRQIAAQAGFSEATLYKHFADKVELMVAVLHERSGGIVQLAQALDALPAASLEAGLTGVARAAILLYSDNFPMLASIFSDRAILSAHQDGLKQHGLGPHRVNEMVIAALAKEQASGRLRPEADLYAATSLLIGACMQHAFLGHMGGWAARRDDDAAAESFAATLAAAVGSHPFG
jgi:AcrR family transcriptional regulator